MRNRVELFALARTKRILVFCMGLLLMVNGTATAADGAWTGGGSDNLWSTSGNWDTVPGTGNIATVDITNNSPLVNMDVATQYDNVYIGDTSADEVTLTVQSGGHLRTDSGGNITFGRLSGSKGRLAMTAGNLTSRQIRVGESGTGTANVSGGTVTLSDWLGVGVNPGSAGTFNMSGGTLTANNMTAGNNGTGTIDLSGGTMDAANWIGIGRETGETGSFIVRGTGYLETGNLSIALENGTGTLTISDSGHVKLVAAGSRLRVGEGAGGATGTINMDGGTLEVGSYIALGYSAGQSGSMDMTAGDVSVNAFVVGLNGAGTFDMSGGNLVPNSHVRVGEAAGEGVWDMSGGLVVATNYISAGWGTTGAGEMNIINMSGGELRTGDLHIGRYGNGRVDLFGGTILVNAYGSGAYTNGLVFDTNGGNGTLNIAGGTLNWLHGDYTVEIDALVLSGDIVAYDGAGAVSVVYDSGSDTTMVTANPGLYDQWTADYGLSGADAVASADPDGDDLNNLYEFGLGGDPIDPADQGISPSYGMVEDTGTNWMTYVYPKRSDVNSGIAYHLELCDDLVSNVWKNGGYSVVGTGPIDFEFNAVTNRIPMVGKPEQFIRLLIEADDIVLADFDGGSYAGWIATGTAFGSAPATGTLPNQHEVTGFEGPGLVNSYLGGDPSTGTLTSPEFTIQREYINFLVGGGNHEGQTCINLWVDGEIVRTQTGFAEEQLRWVYWDVGDLIGQRARIEIVDAATGSWGHINIDSLIQSDSPSVYEIELTVQAEKRYLNIPVDNSESRKWVHVYVDGAETDDYYFELQLADPGKADFWVYMDLSRYAGHKIVLKTRRDATQDIDALEQCYQSDEPRAAATFYTEEKRPQFHFSSQRGWLNDVNGVFYYDGEYHLFYQHNPYGWSWGNMHWGHAESTDLVHWVEQGDAIFPDELGTIFSGTAVVDEMNTSGFQSGADSPIVALYAAAGDHAPEKVPRTQAIAYSTDGGATFSKYAGNPVIENIADWNRDPKVFWYEPTGKWVMVLYLEGNSFGFFTSPDLKQWQQTSDIEFPGELDCPDLFPLDLDGDSNTVKWVLWGGHGTYLVGDFDGATFTPDHPDPLSYAGAGGGPDGSAGYAAQTYSNIPQSDGRCIQMAWMHGWGTTLFEGMPFNQQLTFPVELKLNSTAQGPRLSAWPISEIESLYTTLHSFPEQVLTPASTNLLEGLGNDMKDIYAEFELTNNAATFGFRIRGEEFVYNASTQQIETKGQTINLEPVDGKINMRVLVDRMSVEFFAGDGLVCMQNYLAPPETNSVLEIFTENDSVTLKTLEVNGLESIWN